MARKVPLAKPPNRPPTCPNISPTTQPASLARGAPARAGGGRAKVKSKKVQELELRDEENAKIAHEVAQQRAETRYQNEVHDPSREEIRAHNAQALQKEPGPGFYEVPVPSFQQVVNTRALQNEMIASQMRAAHIQAVEPRNASPSRNFEYNNGDDNNSEDESDARTEGEDDDSEPGEFPKFDRRRLRARERRLKDQKSRHKHRPLVSNAIKKYISITLDEDPLGLEPAKARAQVAMRQASEEDGKLLLKPNQFIVRLMTSRNTNARKPFVKEMRKRVVPYYGFSARTDEATMQMNRLNCEALLNDGRFLVAVSLALLHFKGIFSYM
ncbi:hypothetical protein BDV93DRAFT_565837 [Ceratobasidium sp. AG-I]|nr:hypothetical protein BDV93DRAFT_565837 [Ceratobasidium sp. AG-I]